MKAKQPRDYETIMGHRAQVRFAQNTVAIIIIVGVVVYSCWGLVALFLDSAKVMP